MWSESHLTEFVQNFFRTGHYVPNCGCSCLPCNSIVMFQTQVQQDVLSSAPCNSQQHALP